MSYSFLGDLWDSDGSAAHGPDSGAGTVGGPPMSQMSAQAGSQVQMAQPPVMAAPPQQPYSLAPQPGGERVRESSGGPMPRGQDPNAELKSLLRATVSQLYDNYRLQQERQKRVEAAREGVMAKVDYLTNFVYAVLALCIAIVVALTFLCYRSYSAK